MRRLGTVMLLALALPACSATFDSVPAAPAPAPTSSTTTTTPPTTTSSTTTTTTSTTTSSTTTTSVATSTTNPAPVATVPRDGPIWQDRPASDIEPPDLPAGWTTHRIGASAGGRDITALRREVADPRRTVVVVGGIHGNEPVSPPIVRSLVDVDLPADLDLWLVPELNPDGTAAGTRSNAAGVDLNRNFTWEWRPSDGGPAPASEPETRTIMALIEFLHPSVVVWVHQPLGYVSSIGTTPDAYEQAWSIGASLPVRPDVTQHGGGESWTQFVAGVPSMLVEVESWDATPAMVEAHRGGFAQLLTVLPAPG